MPYAELHCLSNFTFLRGASHPEELVAQAAQLGYKAIAITDECTLAGIVKAHVEAKERNIKLLIGSELAIQSKIKCVLLASSKLGYGNLSTLISKARRRSEKGQYQVLPRDLERLNKDLLAIWLPGANSTIDDGQWLKQLFQGRLLGRH